MFGRVKRAVAVVAIAACASAVSTISTAARADTVPLLDRFSDYSAGTEWRDSTTHGFWRAVFDGYGRIAVTKDDSKVLSLRPKTSADASETHAALVVSKRDFGDIDMTMRMKTVDQLREGKPKPWEVALALWHYKNNTH